jgi:argininosuccinate synthase
MKQTIVLAYAGTLDDSAAIAWLTERRGAAVATLTLDVGQGGDVEPVRARALACGAVRAHVLDVRDEFARDCALPWLQAGALDEPGFASLVRPLIARKLVDVARIERTSAVAHGALDQQIDQAIIAIDPSLRVIGPSRERVEAGIDSLDYARARSLLIPPAPERDRPAPPHLLRRHAAAPIREIETAAHLEIEFEDGVPRSVNGVSFSLTELLESLSVIAGQHGVGRLGAIDAPAAVVLRTAYSVIGAQTGVVRLKLHKGELQEGEHARR